MRLHITEIEITDIDDTEQVATIRVFDAAAVSVRIDAAQVFDAASWAELSAAVGDAIGRMLGEPAR